MSHVSTLVSDFDNKPALKAAASALKIDVKEGVVANLGYGNRKQGDIVMTLKCGEQIALTWDEKKKKYTIHCDRYTGKIERELGGKDFPVLKQMFMAKKFEIAGRKQGFKATQVKVDQKTGNAQLWLER